MSTLDKNLTAPTNVLFNLVLNQASGVVTETPAQEEEPSAYLSWNSKYRAYQVVWRRRRRKKPTASSSGDWESWGAWQGADTCSRKTNRGTLVTPSDTQHWDTWNMANARPRAGTNLFSANQPIYTHYKPLTFEPLDIYDGEQYQVMVRPYNEDANKHGNSKTATLTVIHHPTVTYTSAVLDDDGGIIVAYATNWGRDGNLMNLWLSPDPARPNSYSKHVDVSGIRGNLGPGTFKIPASKLDKNYDVGSQLDARFRFEIPDSGWNSQAVSLAVQSKHPGASPEVEMSVTIDEREHAAAMEVTGDPTGYPWTKVTPWAGWTGPDGVWRTVGPSISDVNLAAKTARFTFLNVPSDIPVYYRVQTVTADSDNDGATTLEAVSTMSSKGAAVLAIGGESAILFCSKNEPGVTWNRSYAPNVEHEVCAGRTREISRHGIGGTATIQVKGDVVDPSRHDMGDRKRLSDWEKMKSKTGSDGYISLPGGFWEKVVVTGIDIDTERPVHSVTLSLTEVV